MDSLAVDMVIDMEPAYGVPALGEYRRREPIEGSWGVECKDVG